MEKEKMLNKMRFGFYLGLLWFTPESFLLLSCSWKMAGLGVIILLGGDCSDEFIANCAVGRWGLVGCGSPWARTGKVCSHGWVLPSLLLPG